MAVTMQVDIVSAEGLIYSGEGEMVFAQAADGEIGVYPNHTQFLSSLKPGKLSVVNGEESKDFFVNGGIIEIQKNTLTVLADSAIRAADLDAAACEQAKRNAESAMDKAKTEMDIAKAQIGIAETVAQINMLSKMKKRLNKTGL